MTTKRSLVMVSNEAAACIAAESETVKHAIADRRSPGLAAEFAAMLAEGAFARAEALVAEAFAAEPPPGPFACASGCAHCCFQKVLVTAAEVLHIAAYLRSNQDADTLAKTRARVVAVDETIHGMTGDLRERAQVFCPLLDDGRCSVYPARPLACRSFHSYDVTACERRFAAGEPDPDVPIPHHTAAFRAPHHVRIGLTAGIREGGLASGELELVAALRIALARENAGDRWRDGRRPFTPAEDPEALALGEEYRRRGVGF